MNIPRILRVLFWIFYLTAFWGAYEITYQGWRLGGSHPIWSGTWGYPTPHHYIVGFIGAGICIFMLEFRYRGETNERRKEKPNR